MQLKTVQFTAYTIIGVDEIQDDKNFQIDENGIAQVVDNWAKSGRKDMALL